MTTDQTSPATTTAQAQTTESDVRTPFDAAAAIVRQVQLAAVHFSACSAQALETPDAISEDASLSASTSFMRPTVAPDDAGFSATTTLLFQVSGKIPGAEDSASKPYAVVRATIEAKYTLKPDAPQFTDEQLKDYALCYGPFHVWGYWREFVQSSLARLDLPQFTIPLFLIAQAPQMVKDKLE